MKNILLFLSLGVAGWCIAAPPNILIVLVDDMGFSDLGCYGSEINTPNLDALAAGGLKFTQFYNTGRCCPTRASLLTGLYPHQAGVGHMTEPAQPIGLPQGSRGQRPRNRTPKRRLALQGQHNQPSRLPQSLHWD